LTNLRPHDKMEEGELIKSEMRKKT
jgi:hypothetical protein